MMGIMWEPEGGDGPPPPPERIPAVVLVVILVIVAALQFTCPRQAAGQTRGTRRTIPQSFTQVAKPVDIKWGGRVVAVSDENNRSLKLVSATSDDWVCTPYIAAGEKGYSCRSMADVVAWIMQEGERTR